VVNEGSGVFELTLDEMVPQPQYERIREIFLCASVVSQFFMFCTFYAAGTRILATNLLAADYRRPENHRDNISLHVRSTSRTYVSCFSCGTFPFERGVEICKLLHNKCLTYFQKEVWKFEEESTKILFSSASVPRVYVRWLFADPDTAMKQPDPADDREDIKEGSDEWISQMCTRLSKHSFFGGLLDSSQECLVCPPDTCLFYFCSFNADLNKLSLELIQKYFGSMAFSMEWVGNCTISPGSVSEVLPSATESFCPSTSGPGVSFPVSVLEERNMGQALAAVTACKLLAKWLYFGVIHAYPLEALVTEMTKALGRIEGATLLECFRDLGFSREYMDRVMDEEGESFFWHMTADIASRAVLLLAVRDCGYMIDDDLYTDNEGLPAEIVGPMGQLIPTEQARHAMFYKCSSGLCAANEILDSLRSHVATERGLAHLYFHGTSWRSALDIVQVGITVRISNRPLDFGPGFYLVRDIYMAIRWAVRTNNQAAVLVYAPVTDWRDRNIVRTFNDANEDWQECCRVCRENRARVISGLLRDTDIVEGPIVETPHVQPFFAIMQGKSPDHFQWQMCVRSDRAAGEFSNFLVGVLFFPVGVTEREVISETSVCIGLVA
jgi:hypothetical protein